MCLVITKIGHSLLLLAEKTQVSPSNIAIYGDDGGMSLINEWDLIWPPAGDRTEQRIAVKLSS